MTFKKIFLFSFIFGMSFLCFSPAKAFSISPLKYTISLDPNDSKDLVVTVKNDSSQKKEYEAVVAGIQQDNLGRSIIKSNSDIAENWIKYQNKKININGGETGDLIFTINIPKNALPSAHYIAIGAQEKNKESVGAQLMTIVVLHIAGTVNELLVLEKFDSIKKYYFNKKLNFLLQLKNTGNIDLALSGKLEIYNFKNNIVNSSPINLGNKLFSQSNRTANFSPIFTDKILWPGWYRSLVVVDYGLTQQQIVGGTNFWYLPVWFLSVVIALLVLIILFFVIRKNKHEKTG